MRVLTIGNMYPPHHLGGYELVWQSAIRHLRRAGHRVRVLTTDFRLERHSGEGAEEDDVHRELRWYWRDHRFPRLSLRQRLELERRNGEVLDRHLRELRPEAIGLFAMGGMSLSLIERARRAGIATAGVVCDDWLVYAPKVDAWMRLFADRPRVGAVAERLTGIPARVDLGGVARWVFLSETVRERALAAGWELRETEVAYPGVDRSLFAPAPAHEWGWRLLYAGRIDRRKGIENAILALERLPPEATLTIDGSGDGEHLVELEKLARRHRLDGRVTLTRSPRERLAERYAEADAVLFPVLWEEPWGLVPLEAMAVGTPVVATGAGGSGEYLRDGENCLIFSPRSDPAALARAVKRLASDPGLRSRLREGGLATAARFEESAFNKAVARALEGAVGESRPGG